MDINKIYFIINEVLDSYLNEGIRPDHLLNYLNTDENNFNFMYNRVYRKLTLENVTFESEVLKECLKDSIRDKISIINDLNK